MKTIRLSVLLVSVFWLSQLAAQPILKNHEKFMANQEASYFVMDTALTNEGQSGENVTWDFAGFTATGQTYKKTYLPPSQTNMGDSFPTAALAIEGNDGVTMYITEKNDTVIVLGTWVKQSAILIKNTTPQLLTIRPMAYNANHTHSTHYSYKFGGNIYTGGGTYKITADGYGTLKLGSGTYTNVLRVKFEGDFYDTLALNGSVTRNQSTAYSWYNVLNNAPLAEMKTITITSQHFNSHNRSVYILKNPATYIGQAAEKTDNITAWFNEGTITIKGLSASANTTLHLYDITGKSIPLYTINSTENTTQLSPASYLLPGVYVLAINNVTGLKTQKIVIQ